MKTISTHAAYMANVAIGLPSRIPLLFLLFMMLPFHSYQSPNPVSLLLILLAM